MLINRLLQRVMTLFGGFEHPRRVWAWAMYDLANQSFTLIVNTLLFGLFFKAIVVGEHTPPQPGATGRGDFLWSLTVAISLFIVVLIGPIAGAVADFRGTKKRWLMTSGVICASLTCALVFIPASPPGAMSMWVLFAAMAIYIPANVAYNLSENFLASFLPEIATRERMGRASAIGWTMGYVGALSLLILVAIVAKVFALGEPAKFRPFFLIAGIWFLIMLVPTMLYLPESAKRQSIPKGRTAAGIAFERLRTSVCEAAHFRDLAILLSAFLVYGFGVQVIIVFAGVIAKDDFGFSVTQLMIFTLQLTVTAGIAAIATGFVQDRIGHRRTIGISLGVWVITALGLAWISHQRGAAVRTGGTFPAWPIWLIGNGIGFGLGSIGTATRATVGALTPAHRTAEFFSLWGLTYKLAGAVGLLIFGAVRSTLGSTASLITLAVFFVAGGAVLILMDERRGMKTAHEAECDAIH